MGKVKVNNMRSYTVIIEDPYDAECELLVNYFLLAKSRMDLHLQDNKIYEFMGEITARVD